MSIKSGLNKAFSCFGFRIHPVLREERPGQDPFMDMKRFTPPNQPLVVFDVGANVGQSVVQFRHHFRSPVIHAFEPGRDAFSELRRSTAGINDLHLNNVALGSRTEKREFINNTQSDMSSFLQPGSAWWGAIENKSLVEVRTVDDYCKERSVAHINVLKSDTQGFDLEVLQGAANLLASNRVHMVYLEITFAEIYKNLPRPDLIYGFLADHGFCLVSFYRMFFLGGMAGWTDALFVNPRYEPAAG